MLRDTDRCFKRVARARKEARGSWAEEGLVVGDGPLGRGHLSRCLRKNILGQDSEVRKSAVGRACRRWGRGVVGARQGWEMGRGRSIQLWSTKPFIPRDRKPLGLLSRAVT